MYIFPGKNSFAFFITRNRIWFLSIRRLLLRPIDRVLLHRSKTSKCFCDRSIASVSLRLEQLRGPITQS